MNTTKLMVIVIVLQSLVLLGQWTGHSLISPVQAQIPDSGAQREKILEETKNVGAKLDKLMELLESGKVQVRVVPADDRK